MSDPAFGGIYAIICLPTGRTYVGSSRCIRKRWYAHKRALLANKGTSKLQRAWDKYGESQFAFAVLERVDDVALLMTREQEHIDALGAYTKGLNSRPKAESNIGAHLPHSLATKEKIGRSNRIAHAGRHGPMPRGGKHSDMAKQRMSATKRALGHKFEYGGVQLTQVEWAERLGTSSRALGNRLRRGWPHERIFSERGCGY